MMGKRGVVVLVLGAMTAAACAEPARLVVTRLDGQATSGVLEQLVPEITLRTDAGRVTLAWEEVLSLRPEGATAAGGARGHLPLRFALADQSSFSGEIISADEGAVAVRLAADAVCRLDLTSVRSIRVNSAGAAALSKLGEVLAELEQRTPRDGAIEELSDVAVVARQQEVLVLRGRVTKIGPEQVGMEWNGRALRLPWSRLGGLIFARPTSRTAATAVRLRSGDVFAGGVVGGSGAGLLLRSVIFEQDVELAWANVERVDCRSDRLTVLSDLEPLHYEFEPFFDKVWGYAADKTLTGRPIRLGGRMFSRGLTMHSRAALTYQLDGQYAQFAALAGIVDEMETRGCVTMRVIGDGRTLWEGTGIRGGESPREVVADIVGVAELTLQVDYDDELDLSDHAAWGFARLIR